MFLNQWRFYIRAGGAKPPNPEEEEGLSSPKFQK